MLNQCQCHSPSLLSRGLVCFPGVWPQETCIELSPSPGPIPGEIGRQTGEAPKPNGVGGALSTKVFGLSRVFTSLPCCGFQGPDCSLAEVHALLGHSSVHLCHSSLQLALQLIGSPSEAHQVSLEGFWTDPLRMLEDLSVSPFPKLHLLVPPFGVAGRVLRDSPISQSRYLKSTYYVQGTMLRAPKRARYSFLSPQSLQPTAEATCYPRARTRHGASVSPAPGTLVWWGSLSVECMKTYENCHRSSERSWGRVGQEGHRRRWEQTWALGPGRAASWGRKVF